MFSNRIRRAAVATAGVACFATIGVAGVSAATDAFDNINEQTGTQLITVKTIGGGGIDDIIVNQRNTAETMNWQDYDFRFEFAPPNLGPTFTVPKGQRALVVIDTMVNDVRCYARSADNDHMVPPSLSGAGDDCAARLTIDGQPSTRASFTVGQTSEPLVIRPVIERHVVTVGAGTHRVGLQFAVANYSGDNVWFQIGTARMTAEVYRQQ